VYLWTALGLVAVFVYLGFLVRSMAIDSYDTWGGLVIAPILVGISIPLLLRFARRNGEDAMAGIFIAALVSEVVVFAVWMGTSIGFLWFNVIGCAAVVALSLILSHRNPPRAVGA
jgi:cytochrome c biogenesis protein CcdA